MNSLQRYFGLLRDVREKENSGWGRSFALLQHYFSWRRSLKEGHSSVVDRLPWLTFIAIDFIKNNIRKKHFVFEFGGGGSSLFFADRACSLVTVEHDEVWGKILLKHSKNISSWKLLRISADLSNSKGDIANPDDYISEDENFIGYDFKKYASSIDQFNDLSFDWVLVDGRARPSCIKHALPKIRKGGYLILDNSNRSYYSEAHKETLKNKYSIVLDGFSTTPYLTEVTRTTIWRKNE